MARAMRPAWRSSPSARRMPASSPLVGLVDQVGGPERARRVHAHVERALAAEAEAPLGPIELGRADPQVEEGAAGLGVAQVVEHRRQAVEAGVAQRDPIAEAPQPGAGRRQGVGVLVEADDHEVRMGVEQRLGVPAPAHRGVDHYARWHGGEQLDHHVAHHRGVGERPAPGAVVCSPAHQRAPAGRRSPGCLPGSSSMSAKRSRGRPPCRPEACGWAGLHG